MKQRNYVAKNAQRSGAGRHKRKDKKMSIYIDDEGRQLTVLKKNIQQDHGVKKKIGLSSLATRARDYQ